MIVDTSVWVDFFNGHDSAQSARLHHAISSGEHIALPHLVLTEVLLGIRTEGQANTVSDLLTAFTVVADLDRDGHVAAARLYRHCRSSGYTIRSTIDCIIAQMCIRSRLPLLTKDRDFTAIAACCPLELVHVAAQ